MNLRQNKKYRIFFIIPLFCCWLSPSSFAEKTNFLFFFVDDFGQMDLGVYGSKYHLTPNMDQLAKEGALFTEAYTDHPRCTPSRAALWTGKSAARLGQPGLPKGGIKGSEITIAEAFKEGGYQTFFAGKWHVMGPDQLTPAQQGFDVNITGGHAGAPATHFYPYNNEKSKSKSKSKEKSKHNSGDHEAPITGLEAYKDVFLGDALTEETIKYIRQRDKNKPFFATLAHYAVHTPLEGKPEDVALYKERLKKMSYDKPEFTKEGFGQTQMRQNNPVYAAMVHNVDQSLGKIIKVLEEEDLAKNTVIVLSSDHGGLSTTSDSRQGSATTNFPFRAGKGWLYEGGTRVPFLIKWPGQVSGGLTIKTPVVLTDLYPTFLEMANLPCRPEQHIDGLSLVPLLKGGHLKDRNLYWHSPEPRPHSTGDFASSAIRCGNYKLVHWYRDNEIELFDLSKDLGEQNNLVHEMPEKAQKLMADLNQWKRNVGALVLDEQKLLHFWNRKESKNEDPKLNTYERKNIPKS